MIRATVRLSLAVIALAAVSCRAQTPSQCDTNIPPITAGYGADGPYKADMESVDNPGFARKPVEIFFPLRASGKRPVVFFSHGYGPGAWETNEGLIDHAVSRGYIVVFSSYPMIGVTMDARYDALWQGFQAAVDKFGDRMDLTRVAFVGHSFGGGANPSMAYDGIVKKGWGSNGAFLFELAPWYVYQMPNDKLAALPKSLAHAVEVYDKDNKNDHRMAIDLYANTPVDQRYYFLVHSETVAGCDITADHAVPGRNPSERQREYALYRPFDALAADAFDKSTEAKAALSTMGASTSVSPYQPLELVAHPSPVQPESYYDNAWSSSRNSRK